MSYQGLKEQYFEAAMVGLAEKNATTLESMFDEGIKFEQDHPHWKPVNLKPEDIMEFSKDYKFLICTTDYKPLFASRVKNGSSYEWRTSKFTLHNVLYWKPIILPNYEKPI